MTDWIQLPHHGYGSAFNTIYVSGCKTRFKKCTRTEGGISKLKAEKGFYSFVQNHQIRFPIPRVYETGADYICTEYLTGYVPLFSVWDQMNDPQRHEVLGKIWSSLSYLHSCEPIVVQKEMARALLYTETFLKLSTRFEEIRPLLGEYSYITRVNDVPCIPFDTLLSILQDRINAHIEKNWYDTVVLCPIHGDPQFHNIMYHPDTRDIVFIDPRGYFGDSAIYGISEYDDAKILFALTGYDLFDEMTISSLDIDRDTGTIHVDARVYLSDIVWDPANEFARLLMITVWLGNAHSFARSNPLKAVYSYFLALYIGSIFLQ